MAQVLDKAEAFGWFIDKLAAKSSAPKAPVYSPPKLKLPEVKAPKDMRVVREREMDLFKQWKYGGKKPEDFEALKESHRGLLQKAVGRFKGAEVPRKALEFEHLKHYRRALETFDDTKGAQLHSWITTNLKKARRFVLQVQNTGRITEPLGEVIGTYKSARTELQEQLGRPPTIDEIVEHSKLSKKEVIQLGKQLKPSRMLSGTGDDESGPTHYSDSEKLIADLVYHKLRPDEKLVHEYLFPKDGTKAVTSSSVIANKLGWHISKVSKAKTSIRNLIDEHLPD